MKKVYEVPAGSYFWWDDTKWLRVGPDDPKVLAAKKEIEGRVCRSSITPYYKRNSATWAIAINPTKYTWQRRFSDGLDYYAGFFSDDVDVVPLTMENALSRLEA